MWSHLFHIFENSTRSGWSHGLSMAANRFYLWAQKPEKYFAHLVVISVYISYFKRYNLNPWKKHFVFELPQTQISCFTLNIVASWHVFFRYCVYYGPGIGCRFCQNAPFQDLTFIKIGGGRGLLPDPPVTTRLWRARFGYHWFTTAHFQKFPCAIFFFWNAL